MNKYNDPNEDFISHLDKKHKLNAYRTLRRSPGSLLNILYTFNLYPGFRGIYCLTCNNMVGKTFKKRASQ